MQTFLCPLTRGQTLWGPHSVVARGRGGAVGHGVVSITAEGYGSALWSGEVTRLTRQRQHTDEKGPMPETLYDKVPKDGDGIARQDCLTRRDADATKTETESGHEAQKRMPTLLHTTSDRSWRPPGRGARWDGTAGKRVSTVADDVDDSTDGNGGGDLRSVSHPTIGEGSTEGRERGASWKRLGFGLED